MLPGVDCSRLSCSADCPTRRFPRMAPSASVLFHLNNSTFNLNSNDPHAQEFYNSQPRPALNNLQLMSCCNLMCRQNCTKHDGTVVPDKTEWPHSDDACISHICNDGEISSHISSCRALPCPIEYHIKIPGECCSVCSSNWASFCPEHADCDTACQFGFAVDEERGCDKCECARRRTTTETSKTPTFKVTTSSTASPSSSHDAPHSVHYYFYLDPADAATKHLLLGLAVACGVILVACLAGIGWYFHRKVYKRVPLMSLRNSSSA